MGNEPSASQKPLPKKKGERRSNSIRREDPQPQQQGMWLCGSNRQDRKINRQREKGQNNKITTDYETILNKAVERNEQNSRDTYAPTIVSPTGSLTVKFGSQPKPYSALMNYVTAERPTDIDNEYDAVVVTEVN